MSASALPCVPGLARGAGQFTTTHWSVVLTAAEGSGTVSAEAVAQLCSAYWYPLYAYVRRKGYEASDAQDLTQEFFARFLEKHSVGTVDRRKGKFRSFLLASLEHFLAKEWTRAHRLKRGGGKTFVAWDGCDPEERYRLEPAHTETAEHTYERRWALAVLEQAMARLADEYAGAGKGPVFAALQPFLSGDEESVSYPNLARQLEMGEGAVRVAVHRLRQRYGDAVRAEIARVVPRPEDADDELRHLFAALA